MKRSSKYILIILCYWLPLGSSVALFQERSSAHPGDSTEWVGQAGDAGNQTERGNTASAEPEEEGALKSYARWIVERFDKSPLFITVLYVVILYSIVTLITLLIIILLNRNKIQREEEQTEYLRQKYQQQLMDYLFDESSREHSAGELQKIASSRFDRQILIDQMIDLSINLKGDIKEQIKELYLILGLKEDSLKKAYSRKWHENVKGFRELAYMNIREANDRIMECVNSGNEILRMEAQISLVRLSDENPYHFLHYMERPLAKWEQITLHEMLIQHNLKVPPFRQWFDSENLTVVKFALEMIAWFKQKGAGKDVIRLVQHQDEEVRQIAIKVCGEIGLKGSLPVLKGNYDGETYNNKLEILRTFARMPDARYLDFLKSVLDKEEDIQLQILATKAMENTDEPGISMLVRLMKSKSEYKNYQIIIRHVLDGRIY